MEEIKNTPEEKSEGSSSYPEQKTVEALKRSKRSNVFGLLGTVISGVFSVIGKIVKSLGVFGIISIIILISALSGGETKDYSERKIKACFDAETTLLSKDDAEERKEFCQDKSNLKRIAVIPVSGVLDTESSNGNGITTPSTRSIEDLKRYLEIARADSSVEVIVLRINSGGGTALASEEMYKFVKEINKEKKVYAYAENFAASGAYLTAIGAEEFYANDGSIVGSIGTIVEFLNYSELMEKIGVSVEVVKTGELKDAGNPFTDENNGATIYKDIVDEAFAEFVSYVELERGDKISEEDMELILKGGIFSGNRAKELGLIDDTMDFDELVKKLQDEYKISDKELEVFEYQSNYSFWDQVLTMNTQEISIFGIDILKVNSESAQTPKVRVMYLFTE